MKRYEKSCGVVVYKDTVLEFLLIKSKAHSHWSFPKGHVELNETEKETAVREVYEETNLKISLIEGYRHKISYFVDNDTIKDVIYFIGQGNGTIKIQKSEVTDYIWLNFEQALNHLTYENDKDLLKSAYKFIIETT